MKNKGYTLVELLLTISIFSIVMVCLISVMNSASVSFRNESFEVEVQKDAQVLTSQIEDLLVDCTAITQLYSDASGSSYRIVDIDSTGTHTHTIVFSALQKNVTVTEDGGASYSVLCDKVEDFRITGLGDPSKDNMCTVSVSVKTTSGGVNGTGSEYSYSSSEDVYFRNNVDGNEKFKIDLDNVAPGVTVGGANTRSYSLGRYEVLNLNAEFGIVNVTGYTYSGNNGYDFLDPSKAENSQNSQAFNNSNDRWKNKALTQASPLSSGYSVYITTKNTTNNNLNNSYNATITGSTSNGTVLTVNITTKPVKILEGSGYIYMPIKNVNGAGFYSFVGLDGICLRDMALYANKYALGEIAVYNGTSYNGSLTGTLNCIEGGTVDWAGGQISSVIKVEQVAVYFDGYDPEYLVIAWKNCQKPDNPGVLTTGKLNYKITITIPSTSGNVDVSQTFRVLTPGSSLN